MNVMTMSRARGVVALALLVCGVGVARTEAPETAYPSMAPLEQYRSKSREDEIALARSAAPPSIANAAEILTLGAHGYDVAVEGKNGFVCIVERSWANDFDSSDFWNPKVRAPNCFNAAAARSVLPTYLKRTEWALSGVSRAEMVDRTKAALAAKQVNEPEVGAMCYMMSKGGYLGDDVRGHWHPHLMFFLPRTSASAWGANEEGSPLFASTGALEPVTIFLLPVSHWSDGTPE
jgi:hypothetical protein